MVSVINGLSERAAFLFGGDRLMYVIGLSFSYVSMWDAQAVDRGARYTVHYLTRGVGSLLCYIGPEYVLKLLRTGNIHLDNIQCFTPFIRPMDTTSPCVCPSIGMVGSTPMTRLDDVKEKFKK